MNRRRPTSICLLVLATSNGHVVAAARLPAMNPAEKFAPRTVVALASSPTRPSSFLLTFTKVARVLFN